MWITQDEAVVIFARYFHAKFGQSASSRARANAKALERRGDTDGHAVWSKVALEIDKGTDVPTAVTRTVELVS